MSKKSRIIAVQKFHFEGSIIAQVCAAGFFYAHKHKIRGVVTPCIGCNGQCKPSKETFATGSAAPFFRCTKTKFMGICKSQMKETWRMIYFFRSRQEQQTSQNHQQFTIQNHRGKSLFRPPMQCLRSPIYNHNQESGQQNCSTSFIHFGGNTPKPRPRLRNYGKSIKPLSRKRPKVCKHTCLVLKKQTIIVKKNTNCYE